MHPRGVYELKCLGEQERRRSRGEYFSVSMHEIQENVKRKLQESIGKYKHRENLKRRDVNFQI